MLTRGASRLRELRTERQLTQGQLAQRLHVHRSYITKIEQGVRLPGRDLLFRLARSLQVRVEELLPNDHEQAKGG